MKKLLTLTIALSLFLLLDLRAQNNAVNFFYNPTQPCTGTPTEFRADTSNLTGGLFTHFQWRIDNTLVHWGTGSSGAQFSTNLTFGWHDVQLQVNDSLVGIFTDTTKTIFVDSVCNLSSISGEVYFDANANGSKDPGELELNNTTIKISDGTTDNYAFSGSNGIYSLFVNPGTYDVSIVLPSYYNVTEPSPNSTYQVNISSIGMTSQFNDFGIITDSIVKDLSITLNNWPLRPGFNGQIEALVRNSGTFPDSSNIVIFLDTLTPIVSSVPSADSIVGNAAYYRASVMQPNNGRRIRITTKIDSAVQLGTPFNLSAFAFPILGDANPQDNFDTLSGVVVGSYDPNDKLVFPSDDSTNSFERGTSLTYTIRFQNTGTFFAERVRIVDQIESNLDINSFHMLAASHSYTYQISNSGRIVWRFDDIMLPAAQNNEPESHGYVKFRIDVDSSLSLGDTVYNSAEIYFDFNLPIITNTVVSTLDSFVTISAIEKVELLEGELINVYPNPFTDELTISLHEEEQVNFELYSIQGERIMNRTIVNGEQINLKSLRPGMYVFKATDQCGKIQSGKLIKN